MARHMDVCTSLLFQLLGWKLSGEKRVPYDTCWKVLGIVLVLTKTPSGQISLANTDARREELTSFLKHTLESGTLSRHEAERLRGRLQFASNHLMMGFWIGDIQIRCGTCGR